MRPSIARSLGWLMNDLIPALRGRPGSTAVHVRHELAGLSLHDRPVSAAAEAVVVEVRLRLPPAARRKDDYALRFPGEHPLAAESLRKDDADPQRFRLIFRFPPPAFSARAELLWRNKLLADIDLPVLSTDDFLAGLSVAHATTSVQVGDRTVAAQAFVAAQCRGFQASLVVKSPTALAPLASLGVRVVFRSERTAGEQEVPVPLASSQLAAKEALLTASLPKRPRRTGTYTTSWYAGHRELVVQRVRAVSGREFLQSLRLSDARFAVADKAGAVRFVRHAPPAGPDAVRLGPCFAVSSGIPGMAGALALAAVAQPSDPPLELAGTLLVTDGPSVFAPGLFDFPDLAPRTGFDLRTKAHTLGTLSLHPVPAATFDAEGGFKPPPDFAWTPTAEDELAERLAKLMREG
jgi:hypothetical protein